MRTIWLGIALMITVVALGLGLWAFYLEPASLRVQEYRLPVPTWPRALDGFRIGVLTDLHTGSPFNDLNKLRDIVGRTNAAQCDLILIPGDLVIQGVMGGTFVAPEDTAQILQELKAPLGVYAVLGNHDWWLDSNRVIAALSAVGIPVLEDRAVKLPHHRDHKRPLWLVGVSDYWEGAHDVKRALLQVPSGETVLLFTHNPDVFPEVPDRVTLTIAGHTHGGQVALPVLGRPIVPSRYQERFAIGHIVEDGRHMFVSPGLGTSILPVRFRVPPEVSVLSLYAENPGSP